jgi:hypothetical protein
MEKTLFELSAEDVELLDLGSVLGQNLTFGLVAGRCSAAQAASLRRLREERIYKRVAPNWRDFCPQFLKMSRTQADQVIQLLDEFGPAYFELAQLTRVSAETYRAIAPSIRDGVLHSHGDAIDLTVENTRKVAAAIAEFRRTLPVKKPAPQLPMHERLAELDKRCSVMIAEFEEISVKERRGENWLLFTATLARMASALRRIEMDNGMA